MIGVEVFAMIIIVDDLVQIRSLICDRQFKSEVQHS